jgi:galactose mutarotase-like enzyme
MGAATVNVLSTTGNCSVGILPDLGGKISSIRFGGHELLQAPLAPYGPRTRTMAFDEGDASGWDECLPSVASCELDTVAGKASIPDHGDLWRVAWQQIAETGSSSTLRADCFSLPLALDRTVSLEDIPNGARLRLDYQVVNTGGYPVPWSWAAHPLFTVEPGDRILLPDSILELRLEGSGSSRLGKRGDIVRWPEAVLSSGSRADLRVIQPAESGIGDKLFAGPLSESENWCALERPRAGLRIRVKFDPSATPYLGLWICYGGWPDRPGPKQMCVALEPATAPVDSLAHNGPWSLVLAPGDCFSWSMVVEIESLQGVDRHA